MSICQLSGVYSHISFTIAVALDILILLAEYLSLSIPITLSSFSYLFLVSILHSSQKTKLSLLDGSLCCSKQPLQILCPHYKVSGYFTAPKQLRHCNACSKTTPFITLLLSRTSEI